MVIEIKSKEEFEKAIKGNKKSFIDFGAKWCPPCRQLEPIVESLSEKIKDTTFFSVDIDNNQDLANQFKVSSIPTLILFENGEESKKNIGFMDEDSLEEFIG